MLYIKFNILVISTFLIVVQALFAIHRGADDLPYGQDMKHKLDKPLNDKYGGKNFFMNLGPTGIRARIDPESPKAFKVMFVFQDKKSPAKGKINIGDYIVGANGKKFSVAHGFHRKQAGSRGWQGPPFELAGAIEDAQGKDGKLKLLVISSKKGAVKSVTIELEKVGRFSETFPWDCERSEKLSKELCDFIISNGINGRHHYKIQQLLSLLAAGDKRAEPLVKSYAQKLLSGKVLPSATGMATWGWGYTGILLGEYYYLTKDKKVVEKAKEMANAYELGMDYSSGGFSHRPYPYINQRASDTGVKGYGSMAGPGGLSMLAQSLFKANGLSYSLKAYMRTHEAYLLAVGENNPKASIAYGFSNGWETLLIRLKDKKSPCKSKLGNGYICPTGMKDIGPFVCEKWEKKGDKWDKSLVSPSNYPWLKSEASQLMVYEYNLYVEPSVMQRIVFRPKKVKEPNKAFNTQPGGGGHVAPMGMGAAAHFIGNKGNKSWNYLGAHLAGGCALSPGMLFDGHADASMHAFFSVVGALRANKKQLRSYLDYVKTLIVLAETHDGGLVDQPFGCQRNATCSIERGRTAYSHVALMILSMHKKRIMLTGAEVDSTLADANNPYSSLQTSDFQIKLCKKEGDTIKKGKSPFLTTLKKLDKYSLKEDEKGKEAYIFAERLRSWITKRTVGLLELSKSQPVIVLGDLKIYLKLVKGMDGEKGLKEKEGEIKEMEGVKDLSKFYKSFDKILATLKKKKESASAIKTANKAKVKLAETIEKYLAKKAPHADVKSEIEVLLKKVTLNLKRKS
jgi:hypothetical protein